MKLVGQTDYSRGANCQTKFQTIFDGYWEVFVINQTFLLFNLWFLAEPWFVTTALSPSIQFSKDIGKYDFVFITPVLRKVLALITNVS